MYWLTHGETHTRQTTKRSLSHSHTRTYVITVRHSHLRPSARAVFKTSRILCVCIYIYTHVYMYTYIYLYIFLMVMCTRNILCVTRITRQGLGMKRATSWQVLSQIRPCRHGRRVFFSSFYLIIIYIYACIIYSYMCICVQQDRNHRNKHDNGEVRERDSLCVCVKLSRAQSVQSQCVLHGQPTAASTAGKNPPWSVPARAGHLLHECYNDKAVTNKLLQLSFGEGCFSPAVGTGSG